MNMRTVVGSSRVAVVVGVLLVLAPALSQATCSSQTVVPGPLTNAHQFGARVAADGDVVIASDLVSSSPASPGPVTVFRWNSSSWVTEQQLLGSDITSSDDFFGFSIAVSGNVAVIGSLKQPGGAAYVFRFNGATWVEEQRLTPTGAVPTNNVNYFGQAVAIAGTRILVSDPWDGQGGAKAGAVYSFHFDGTRWVQDQKLAGPADADPSLSQLGTSLAIEGTRAIMGERSSLSGNPNTGAAFVYSFNGSQWVQMQKLTNGTGQLFGTGVALSGDAAIFSAWALGGPVSVFRLTGSAWVKEQSLYPSDRLGQSKFGLAVAIKGNVAVVGASFAGYSGELVSNPSLASSSREGVSYVFRFDGSQWIEAKRLVLFSGAIGDSRDGTSVAISDRFVVSGAPGVASNAMFGAVHIFPLDCDATPPPLPALVAPVDGAGVLGIVPGLALDWADVTDPSGVRYAFEVDTTSAFSGPVEARNTLTDSGFTLPNMQGSEPFPGPTAYWRVRAIDGVGNLSAWSSTRSIVTLVPQLVSPINWAAITTTSTPTFQWTWPGDATGLTFQLQVTLASNAAVVVLDVSGLTGMTLTPTTPLPADVYGWKVRASNQAGAVGSWSTPASFTLDTVPPTVALTAPTAGVTLSGSAATLSATASDNLQLLFVSFIRDGVTIANDSTDPYSATWDSRTVANGSHTFTATAQDGVGNTTTSAAVTVTVSNPDLTPPTVSIVLPANGATVSNTVNVSATSYDGVGPVSDQTGIMKLELYQDGVLLGTNTATPPYLKSLAYSLSWNTRAVANGAHTLLAKAYDAGGNVTSSSPIAVTVYNTSIINASAGIGGAITPSGTITVPAGGSQTLIITPNIGYKIQNVLIDNSISAGAVSSYTFTNVTTNHGINATFSLVSPTTYTITATAGTGGTIAPSGSVSVTAGASQLFTMTPNTGYTIASVLVDGVNQGALATYTFSNVQAAHTISASFSLIPPTMYTLTLTTSGTGTGTLTTSPAAASYAAGTVVTLTATPAVSSLFSSWGGALSGSVNPTTLTIDANKSVSATFTLKTFTLTASAGANGTISPTGAVSVNYGASQSFMATPNAGYTIANVLVDGVNQGALATYTFSNVQANHTISASFSLIPPTTYTITASAGMGGTMTPSGSVSVTAGASQLFTMTPNTGYNIQNVLVDGVSVGAVSSYTFSNVQASHTMSASFVLKTYTLTASAGTNGTISPTGAVTVNYGASQAFTMTPNTGYQIASVLVDGVSVGALGTYTFSNVQANHTISASFSLIPPTDNPPTVSLTSPLNGATVAKKTTITLTATATDDLGVTQVAFYINGTLKCTDPTSAYSCAWKVPARAGQSYQLQARATDTTGHVSSSALVTVTAR